MKALLLNQHLVNLVDLLNDGQYHDGTNIGHLLCMTRSAVWKTIKKLKNYGITIGAVKGKGYTLLEPLKLLNKDIILQILSDYQRNDDAFNSTSSFIDSCSFELNIFEYLDSTNNYLKLFFNQSNFKMCFSELQTQGRGRLSRNWYSPFGQNIYFSCLYLFNKDVSDLGGLSLITSLAIVKTLALYKLSYPILVKWPNDIICGNKKLSGSLIEVQAETNGVSKAVIGIGINVNMLHNKNHSIQQAWTSLREIVGHYIDRNFLCAMLIHYVVMYLKKFEEQGLTVFLEEWSLVDGLKDQTIFLKSASFQVEGQVKGINEYGHLILKLKNNVIKTFSSGEVEKIIRPTSN